MRVYYLRCNECGATCADLARLAEYHNGCPRGGMLYLYYDGYRGEKELPASVIRVTEPDGTRRLPNGGHY